MTGGRILRLPSALAERGRSVAVGLDEVRRAEERILEHLRYTPLMIGWLTCEAGARHRVALKLENLQLAGGFSVRGCLNVALSLPYREVAVGMVGYGVMHGSGVAYTGHVLQVPTVVYLQQPMADADVVKTLELWGATVVVSGKTVDDARRAAFRRADRDGLLCIHPTANLAFVAGCATVALEMLEVCPELDVIVTSVGFGSLLAGIALAAKQIKPRIRVVGVDRYPRERTAGPAPAKVDHKSSRLVIGELLEKAAPECLELVERHADEIVFVSRADTNRASRLLWSEMEVRTGTFGSSAVAALLGCKVAMPPGQEIGAVISSPGGDGLF